MENNEAEKEFITDEALTKKIREAGQSIKAPEMLLKSILEKLPDMENAPIASPYVVSPFMRFWQNFNKTAVVSLTLFLLIALGGFAYLNSNNPIKSSPNLGSPSGNVSITSETSDSALEQDIMMIDSQLKMLDSDNAQI
jgi:hypothetical protein